MMKKDSSYQFTFLPYVALRKEIKIGNFLFWPYQEKKNEYIKDNRISKKIDLFLKQYVDNSKKKTPLKNFVLISYKLPGNFKPLTKAKIEDLKDTILILFFCTMIKSLGSYSADNFQFFQQNFSLRNNDIATVSGSLISFKRGGMKINEVYFVTPLNLEIGFIDSFCNLKLITALEELQRDKIQRKSYMQIVNALQWVSYSLVNTDNFNFASRIVMLMTAFEFLFGKIDDRKDFRKKIGKLVCTELDVQKKFRRKEVKDNLDLSLKEWWALEFYILRNKIVHGEEIHSSDFLNKRNKNYFLVGLKFFEECLKKKLNEYSYYRYDSADSMRWEMIRSEV